MGLTNLQIKSATPGETDYTLSQPQRIAAATMIANDCRELWQKHNQHPEWLERAMPCSESAPTDACAEFAEDMARNDALDEAQQRRTYESCDR